MKSKSTLMSAAGLAAAVVLTGVIAVFSSHSNQTSRPSSELADIIWARSASDTTVADIIWARSASDTTVADIIWARSASDTTVADIIWARSGGSLADCA